MTRVRHAAPNTVGLKVSDVPFDAVKPYLGLGLDVFIGQEPLALEGLEAGAVGSVSGLASAFPAVVADLIHNAAPRPTRPWSSCGHASRASRSMPR